MGVQPLIVMRGFTLGLMWIEEERWIEEENGIMNIDKGVFLLEILRLRMYSLESSQSLCPDVQVCRDWCRCLSLFLPTPFIGLRQLNFHVTLHLVRVFTLSTPLGLISTIFYKTTICLYLQVVRFNFVLLSVSSATPCTKVNWFLIV